MTTASKNLLALDVGSKRIGVAIASAIAKLPQPLTTVDNDVDCIERIKEIIKQEDIGVLIIGLPRNLEGNDTEQTKLVREFGRKIAKEIDLAIHWQDEALTSRQAESELANRGMSYNKGHVDALAATYILSDYLSEHREL